MSWPSVVAARLRGLFLRDRLERELDDEVRFHLEMLAEDNRRAGMNPTEARYKAMRSFGGVEPMKETLRERRTLAWVETVVQDVAHGARFLFRRPDSQLPRASRLHWRSASQQPSSRS
jgi:putative ABC transport system permease protein